MYNSKVDIIKILRNDCYNIYTKKNFFCNYIKLLIYKIIYIII